MLSDAFGQHQDRTPTHGYAATREAAMAAFAKSWRRDLGYSGGTNLLAWPDGRE
jgi:hypothetical protein